MKQNDLVYIKKFHRHLGPWVILGYVIGELTKNYFSDVKKVTIENPLRPPYSCLIDGFQLSSQMTIGRGEIIIKKSNILIINLSGLNRKIVIKINRTFRNTLNIRKNYIDLSKKLYKMFINYFN